MNNMSYCQFENTLADFKQCVEAIGNAETLNDFSNREIHCAEELCCLAEQYISWYSQLEEDTRNLEDVGED